MGTEDGKSQLLCFLLRFLLVNVFDLEGWDELEIG